MRKEDLNIVFMGTPDFAVESLRALVEGGYRVAGVVTMPDKPVGKHQSVPQASAVKRYALSQHLPLLQPDNLKDGDFLEALRAWNAALQIVVAFRMLPEVVWAMPRLGTFNLHASLLPQYRGAAPINWALINGETETGVTTFFLAQAIDTGAIIAQAKTPVAETDNAGSLHDRLMRMGADLVVETVDAIRDGSANPVAQSEAMPLRTALKPAPKIFKETCRIDWNRSAKEVCDFIRGLSPYPAAFTELMTEKGAALTFKIFEAERMLLPHGLPPGRMVSDGKTFLNISTPDGFVGVKELQQAGKKRMPAGDFLRGNGHLL
ncbi:MAG: methionyl-tRNA formyltransferase [Dysgonamonadaceae bacterium]|nr:methionyl-tRNA formyltransferase [Dysgonamonadaceae bacterium]